MPRPTESEEEKIRSLRSEESTHATSTCESDPDSAEKNSEHLSRLGDSSSLFDISPAPAPPPQSKVQSAFKFGHSTTKPSACFSFVSPSPSDMVVEREPPKASPQKSTHPTFQSVKQPEFGKPSPLQNRLKPDNVFNVPKPYHPRPEHHRPAPHGERSYVQSAKDIVHSIADPFKSHRPVQPQASLDVVEIPRPSNIPSYTTHPKPPQIFSAYNAPSTGFSAVNAHQQPFVDLTKPQNHYSADPALFDDRFGAADPYTYVDAGQATENIKALLEGAFDDDDEDKPRTRGRKKKVEAAVAGLADKLKGLEVKAEEDKKKLDDEAEDEEEEEEDDGTVEGLKVKLLPHQVDGVAWMRDKEIGAKKKNGILPKGGILADDMGLVISLLPTQTYCLRSSQR